MHIVLLEWDGRKPPTRWYDRLDDLGLRVRGDKEYSPVERRLSRRQSEGKTAVVFQESTIMCESESTAKTLAHIAGSMGAHVQLVSASIVDMNLSTRDAEIMQRLDNTLGRRGRRPGDPSEWCVTCYEECVSMKHREAFYVVSCPSCASMSFNAVPGDVMRYKVPDGELLEVWMRHRFSRGVFEVPETSDEYPLPPDNPSVSKSSEQLTLNNFKTNGLLDDIKIVEDVAGRATALTILDAIFCGRTYIPEDVRKERRMRACLHIMDKDAKAVVNIRESPTMYDILDASHIDPLKVALIWLRVFARKNGSPV